MKIFFLILKKKILNRLSKFFKFIDTNAAMLRFIEKDFSDIIEKYRNLYDEQKEHSENSSTENANIWIFWWQGYENAPPIVKKCINSTRKNAGAHPVILLTKENWQEYADIPEYITGKVESGAISLTHFSDILRMVLLADHGGLWLDATIFVSKEIPGYCFSLPYFSIHYNNPESKIAKGKWTGFCQGAKKNSVVHCFCRDIFFAYWKKYSKLADYFLIDYAMLAGYRNIPEFKKLVDAIPFNNQGVKELDRHFNDKFSSEIFSSILENSVFFKLNWKREYKEKTDGKQTIYSWFMENTF